MTDQAATTPETPFSNATIQAIETIVEEAAYHCRTTCQIALTLEQWRYIAAALKHFSTPAQPAPAEGSREEDQCIHMLCEARRLISEERQSLVDGCGPARRMDAWRAEADAALLAWWKVRDPQYAETLTDLARSVLAWQAAQSERAGLSAEEQRDVDFLRNASRGCSSEKDAIQRLLAIIDRLTGAKP